MDEIEVSYESDTRTVECLVGKFARGALLTRYPGQLQLFASFVKELLYA